MLKTIKISFTSIANGIVTEKNVHALVLTQEVRPGYIDIYSRISDSVNNWQMDFRERIEKGMAKDDGYILNQAVKMTKEFLISM